ncbi:MAG: tRNA guanosine(34) transglycosylase Tgt [Termitinemataceae bacterium]|nr:MAG: tRNA guanosine(34) transglycosylase Tgt [Termitinemataceae bacterium]
MKNDFFSVSSKDENSCARCGIIRLPHGDVQTPVFMPVGTNGTVKAITKDSLKEIGFEIILSNTYHLYLRPGTDVIRAAHSLHDFCKWDRNILTDSGGFQIFSLSSLRTISDEGAHFRSHIDGSSHTFTPENVCDIQCCLNSDIQMQLDVCSPWGISENDSMQSLLTTDKWLARAKQRWLEHCDEGYKGKLFAIVQGSFYKEQRKLSAEKVIMADTPGIAIGGLSVGESKEIFLDYLNYTAALLPDHKPRYVMGIGTPDYILSAIENGIDMFDCVLPTRVARNGLVLTSEGPLSLKKQEMIFDFMPIDLQCNCIVCKTYSRSYMRHLFKSGEILFSMLATYHNLYFLHNLILQSRKAIKENRFMQFKKDFLEKYNGAANV